MASVATQMNAQGAAAANNNAEKTKTAKRSLKKNVVPQEFNGPARPGSGFMLFSTKYRDQVTAEVRAALKADEKFKVSMVACKLGEKWKAEAEDAKAVFNKQAAELKTKYEAKMEAWKKTPDYKLFVKASALHNKKKADKKATVAAKASGMPQRPMAGYMLFANDCRDDCRKEIEAKGGKYSVMEGAGLTKQKWTALGEEGQKPYQEKYAVAKAKYAEELAAWQESDAGKTYAKAKAVNAKRKAQNSKVGRAKRVKKNEEDEDEDVEEDEDVVSDVEESAEEAGQDEE